MNAYECQAKLLDDGHLEIPEEIKQKLHKNHSIKVIILTEAESPANKHLEAVDKLDGLLSDISDEDIEKFDGIINERINFKRKLPDI